MMRLMLQKGAIWGLIALSLTNQISGNASDFEMNVIKLKMTSYRVIVFFKTNSVVRLKYGTAPYIFSYVTNIKYQHREDLPTILF